MLLMNNLVCLHHSLSLQKRLSLKYVNDWLCGVARNFIYSRFKRNEVKQILTRIRKACLLNLMLQSNNEKTYQGLENVNLHLSLI